jgi:hypothetical protein
MARRFVVGDCVQIRDGRIGRVRAIEDGEYRVRVLRSTSKTHQFLLFKAGQLKRVTCPKGWMSPEGYRRYLKPTLEKMQERQQASKRRGAF